MPGWSDDWLVTGAAAPGRVLLTVWNRTAEAGSVTVPAAGMMVAGGGRSRVLFTSSDSAGTTEDRPDVLVVSFPGGPSACVVEVVPDPDETSEVGARGSLDVRP